MSFGSGPSFGVLSTTCQSGLLLCSNIHTRSYGVGSFTERAVFKSQCACNDFFVGAKKIHQLTIYIFKIGIFCFLGGSFVMINLFF
jgi:hypothetical protein